jgi:hypothetical protein
MKTCERSAPKELYAQYAILTEKHRAISEELRFRHRLNFSEAIREGIELLARQYEPSQTTGIQSEV